MCVCMYVSMLHVYNGIERQYVYGYAGTKEEIEAREEDFLKAELQQLGNGKHVLRTQVGV